MGKWAILRWTQSVRDAVRRLAGTRSLVPPFLSAEVPHYDRSGLYWQAAFVLVGWGFWELWPSITGRPIEVGFAIGALGFAAVVMTVRADRLTKAERVVWVLIGFAFFVAEVHVIDEDHIQQDREHRVEMQKQETEFEQTMREFSRTNNDEGKHFGELLNREDGIFRGMRKNSRDTEDALSGGNSFAVVLAMWVGRSDFPLLVSVAGKNTLYDVSIEIQEGPIDDQYMVTHMKEYLEGKLRNSYHFPAISTTYTQPLGKEIHPDPAKVNEYHFWVWSRNKPTTEVLRIKFDPKTKNWVEAYQISRDDRKLPILTVDFDGTITKRLPK